MKQIAEPAVGHAEKSTQGPARSRPTPQRTVAPAGHLAQLSAVINGSPQVQGLKSLAVTINQGAPAQLRGVQEFSAGPEHETAQLEQSSSPALGQSAFAPLVPSGSKVFQLHKGENEFDETEDDMLIYKVVKLDTDEVVYVGQTELSVGLDKRFSQHCKSGYHDHWSDKTHKIVKLEGGSWTRFETDCAEQYWIDHFGGGENLENGKNQVSNKRFEENLKYQEEQGVTIFRGEAINFPKGWHPAK